MKISLNTKFIDGPAGGGVQFANYLKNYLEKRNIKVVNNLNDSDIDIIMHIAPFTHLMSIASYSYIDAYIYKINHPKTIIIQRINECDERKDTNYMNNLLVDASKYSDYIVYIASWLKPLMEKNGLNKKIPSKIILNGADTSIFNMDGKTSWNGKEKLKIVTHHWGGNHMKGHDVYKEIDNLLEKERFRDLFEFTYIGNYPSSIVYKNTTLIPANISGKKLAMELKKYHVYITASINEPAGMHHIEGASCGLPILFRNSGALPEYCNDYGVEFNNKENIKEKLFEIRDNYNYFFKKLTNYNNTSEKMNGEFYELFKNLYSKREDFVPSSNYPKILLRLMLRLKKVLYVTKIWIIKYKLLVKKNV